MVDEKRRPGPERAFTDAQVVTTALNLLDEGGADAVSIRRIAARMGVAPNAVYTYFPDKAALLRAVVDRLIGENDTAVLRSAELPWRERLRAVALDIRAVLLAHPGSAALLMSSPIDGPNSLALGEAMLGLLAAAGLSPDEAARASYAIIVYVLGAIALEAAEVDQTAAVPPEKERIAIRRRGFDAVPAEHFPLSAASADVMARYIGTEQFIWGLDRLLDGLEGFATRS
ncbi:MULTISPECIES: TetR/AcrR family transcriptional regulator [unclassified Leifsonia]|uniref:TetR/AcrR family transcriptional regulator n=1 Tax=unclassified Leifsonia TaxID=2663824 RepID=UPI0007017624|nr:MULTISPECIES: TetR/AcrR family transcriptional regulator [unclassified Leifsonia]KQX05408.1 TetR family transcriptional regulator [Leifsonia sp. Root1293]KRA09041.1 TetR family transcriptional regulator [Leifsonia sp. Root60]